MKNEPFRKFFYDYILSLINIAVAYINFKYSQKEGGNKADLLWISLLKGFVSSKYTQQYCGYRPY